MPRPAVLRAEAACTVQGAASCRGWKAAKQRLATAVCGGKRSGVQPRCRLDALSCVGFRFLFFSLPSWLLTASGSRVGRNCCVLFCSFCPPLEKRRFRSASPWPGAVPCTKKLSSTRILTNGSLSATDVLCNAVGFCALTFLLSSALSHHRSPSPSPPRLLIPGPSGRRRPAGSPGAPDGMQFCD